MAREILFRGKRVDNGKWVEGYYLKAKNHWHKKGIHEDWIATFTIQNGGWCNVAGKHAVIPETVGQFTGLTDKNGTKIFEGDILKQKTTPEFAKVNPFEWEHYGIVRFGYYNWNEGEAGYSSVGWYIEPLKSVSIKPKDYLVGNIQAGLNQCDILDKYYPMEVIGNIHDNPELLERGCDNG